MFQPRERPSKRNEPVLYKYVPYFMLPVATWFYIRIYDQGSECRFTIREARSLHLLREYNWKYTQNITSIILHSKYNLNIIQVPFK